MAAKFKPVHLLRISKSLDSINDCAGLLIMTIDAAHGLAEHMSAEDLRRAITDIQGRAADLRAALWPDED